MFVLSGAHTLVVINFLIVSVSGIAYYNHQHRNHFIGRDDWKAVNANGEIESLALPVSQVIIAHTVTPGCDTEAACASRVLSIQNYHMNTKHWSDIGYNFLVGGDGGIYVGRGWNKLGTHTAGHNSDSIGVGLIGNFSNIWPARKQLSALKYLMGKGVQLKKLKSDYIIYPHRALIPTESPGDKVIDSIDNWSHYYTNHNAPEFFVRDDVENGADTTHI